MAELPSYIQSTTVVVQLTRNQRLRNDLNATEELRDFLHDRDLITFGGAGACGIYQRPGPKVCRIWFCSIWLVQQGMQHPEDAYSPRLSQILKIATPGIPLSRSLTRGPLCAPPTPHRLSVTTGDSANQDGGSFHF